MIEPDLLTDLEAMTTEQRAGALVALDHVTRPLTPREIEHALRVHGVPKSRAVVIACSIRKLGIVAVIGPEDRT